MSSETRAFMAPCSYLDIEGMQTWLEDMAADGWLLQKRLFFLNRYRFYRISPLKTRYRLMAVSDNLERWNTAPNADHQSLAEEFGWEYVCKCKLFHVYRAYDEEARELNTDPTVQAESLRYIQRRALFSALIAVLIPLAFMAILWFFSGTVGMWRSIIRDYTIFGYFRMFILLSISVMGIYRSITLLRLRHRLKTHGLPIERKDWQKKARLNRVSRCVGLVLFVFLLYSSMVLQVAQTDGMGIYRLAKEGPQMPFPTVLDLAKESDIASIERSGSSSVNVWSHYLSPINYTWSEITDAVDADGNKGMVSLTIDYHELCSEWLARRIANEYKRQAIKIGTPMEKAADSGWDMAYFYLNSYGKPTAVLQKGKIVMRVEFPRQDLDDPYLNFDHWIETMLAKLNSASR